MSQVSVIERHAAGVSPRVVAGPCLARRRRAAPSPGSVTVTRARAPSLHDVAEQTALSVAVTQRNAEAGDNRVAECRRYQNKISDTSRHRTSTPMVLIDSQDFMTSYWCLAVVELSR